MISIDLEGDFLHLPHKYFQVNHHMKFVLYRCRQKYKNFCFLTFFLLDNF